MMRRPPRSTRSRSSAASDVYKRQGANSTNALCLAWQGQPTSGNIDTLVSGGYLSFTGTITAEYYSGYWQFVITSGAKIVAVSYTHLRAHETVLDLVCRLLLEKKKKTKKYAKKQKNTTNNNTTNHQIMKRDGHHNPRAQHCAR